MPVKKLLHFEEMIKEGPSPIRALKRKLAFVPDLPVEDQKYISKTIDMLVEKHKIKKDA